MRTNLKLFRVKHNLSQEEICHRIGCSRATYAAIENGVRSGRMQFWSDFAKAFAIPPAELWELSKDE